MQGRGLVVYWCFGLSLPSSFSCWFLLFRTLLYFSLPNFLPVFCFVSFPYPFCQSIPLTSCAPAPYTTYRESSDSQIHALYLVYTTQKAAATIFDGTLCAPGSFTGVYVFMKVFTVWASLRKLMDRYINLAKRRMPAICKLKQTNYLLMKSSIADMILLLLMDSVYLCNGR